MVTLEQAIEEEEFKADYCRKLEKITRGTNPTIFHNAYYKNTYHEQVAEWLKELLLIKQTREKLNENFKNDDVIICPRCGQKVIKSIRFDDENFYCFCPYCGTQINDNK